VPGLGDSGEIADALRDFLRWVRRRSGTLRMTNVAPLVTVAELDAAAIVIGSRGFTAARELLQGSVSHDLAEHAGRPVIVAPPPHTHAKL
jgi:nucleotide-binding universal stress UspA family protein